MSQAFYRVRLPLRWRHSPVSRPCLLLGPHSMRSIPFTANELSLCVDENNKRGSRPVGRAPLHQVGSREKHCHQHRRLSRFLPIHGNATIAGRSRHSHHIALGRMFKIIDLPRCHVLRPLSLSSSYSHSQYTFSLVHFISRQRRCSRPAQASSRPYFLHVH